MQLAKRLKKSLIINGIIFSLIASATFISAVWSLKQSLIVPYQNQGIALSKSVANFSASLMFGSPYESLQSVIDGLGEIEGLSYIFISDSTGIIVSHTFSPVIPQLFSKTEKASRAFNGKDFQDAKPKIRNLKLPELGKIIDIGLPIMAGVAGQVHVGLKQAIIDAQIQAFIIRQIGITIALFFASTGITYLVLARI
jgi:sensor histidine kinase regulating citrate/malate metabolism